MTALSDKTAGKDNTGHFVNCKGLHNKQVFANQGPASVAFTRKNSLHSKMAGSEVVLPDSTHKNPDETAGGMPGLHSLKVCKR